MNDLGEKIKQVFGSVAVYKDPKNYEAFNGYNLPSFIKDYIVSKHIAPDGTLRGDAMLQFLGEHIPQETNSVKSRLMRGEVMTLLTRFIVSTNLHSNRVQFSIPDMGINYGETEIPHHLIVASVEDNFP